MNKITVSQNEEIEELKEQLESQKQCMDDALKLADQALACRPPPRVYALWLKEKFLLFQLMLTLKNMNVEFKSAQEFYGLYQTLPPWQQNLLCELYVYNFVIPLETEWNLFLYIGYVHLKSLMLCMSNEENYDRHLNDYRDEERAQPLPLRAESSKPDEILWDWFTLTYGKRNPKVRDKIFATRTKVYAEYENFPTLHFREP